MQLWMIKDPKKAILPLMGVHLTRKEAILKAEERFIAPWRLIRKSGWKVVKVKIIEDATERTDNK